MYVVVTYPSSLCWKSDTFLVVAPNLFHDALMVEHLDGCLALIAYDLWTLLSLYAVEIDLTDILAEDVAECCVVLVVAELWAVMVVQEDLALYFIPDLLQIGFQVEELEYLMPGGI